MTVKVRLDMFSGLGRVYSRQSDGLAAILRGILIDNARAKVEASGVHDFTDNSTGAAGAVALPGLASGAINATVAGGATAAALNTSLGKVQNAGAVIAGTLNEARALLGLPLVTSAAGVVAAADTIPALDKTNAATSGATAADFASAMNALAVAEAIVYDAVEAANEVLVAVGAAPVALPKVPRPSGDAFAAIPAVTTSPDGTSAAAQVDVQAELVGVANAIATLAAAWNAAMDQGAGPGAGPLHVIAG